jgi:hypothetical protein
MYNTGRHVVKKEYKGLVVEESLEDNRAINEIEIVKVRITKEEDPAKRWHVYKVKVSTAEMERLSQGIRQGWYMHFWKGKRVTVVFKNQRFELDSDYQPSWTPAIQYGLFIGIPREQLDFPIK